MVYGEKVDKHLDYRIVNRTAKFKENTCQKINTAKGKIVGTTKAVIDAIKKPFDYLSLNIEIISPNLNSFFSSIILNSISYLPINYTTNSHKYNGR